MPRTILLAVFITVTQLCSANDSVSYRIPPMQELLTEIVKVTGIENKFTLKAGNVMNIEASISHRKKLILYNPVFISWINTKTHDKWASVALLAHEIGHHIKKHTSRRSGSKPRLELAADEFAGYVLHKLGASLEQSQEVMYYISNEKGSSTHPGRADRLRAIQRGWSKAGLSSTYLVMHRRQ
jgi:hypothetical protein